MPTNLPPECVEIERRYREAPIKTARVWGSAAFDGQSVGRDHVLSDGDLVELRI